MANLNIPVAKPFLLGNEKKYVNECLDEGWISSNGKFIKRFEDEFAKYINVKHAISINNGTTALHVAMLGMGVRPGDEVLVPSVTYVATANAVSYCGGTPVFLDVLENTLNIDPSQIEKKITPNTKGIIPVHLYGHPANMIEIMNIARKHNLWVVEDAAEAHGALIQNQKIGGIGNCAIFSFYGNKIVTTGEGGMITTNDDELAEKMTLLKTQGMDPTRRYWFPIVGYNYRMTNIQAALGCAQLETVDASINSRRQIAEQYRSALASLEHQLILPKEENWATHVYWMFNVFIREGDSRRRDSIMDFMATNGIETRPVFYPLPMLPPYASNHNFPISYSWAARGINLPTFQGLNEMEIEYIASMLNVALSKFPS